MKLLLISLSVVFCFSCSKDTPTSPPISPKIELDTSLKKEDDSYSIGRWSSANEDFVETGYNLYVDKKWRFISYIPSDTLGRVKVKGGFAIEYRNPNPISISFGLNRLSFVDKYNFQIAEYNIEYKIISVEANGYGSYSFNFEIDLDNISLANEIVEAQFWIAVYTI